jgi:RNA recognition motif. (a.k.a. RRM, RBD, or RNP domain)
MFVSTLFVILIDFLPSPPLKPTFGTTSGLKIEDIHLVREEDTGKSKGFGFVKYEDSRSCILAVDNFAGVKVGNFSSHHTSALILTPDLTKRC